MPERSRPGTSELRITTDDGVELAGEQAGTGPPIVLLHGLTATRRYVVMGSRLLERSGRRVIVYDARGHGRSAPAADAAEYGYERLARDLLVVMDSLDIERATLAGASMGAQTIIRFALDHPERVAALGLITPAYDPDTHMTGGEDEFAAWDALAQGLREGGVEGFLAAYDFTPVPDAWRATVEKVVHQRLSAHDHPDAVADALQVVPRSRPFERFEELSDDRGADGRDRLPRRGRSGAPAGGGRTLRAGDHRREVARGGARSVAAGVAGGAGLASAAGAHHRRLRRPDRSAGEHPVLGVRDNVRTYARGTRVGRQNVRSNIRSDAGAGAGRTRPPAVERR